jgi:hypothetical protein
MSFTDWRTALQVSGSNQFSAPREKKLSVKQPSVWKKYNKHTNQLLLWLQGLPTREEHTALSGKGFREQFFETQTKKKKERERKPAE